MIRILFAAMIILSTVFGTWCSNAASLTVSWLPSLTRNANRLADDFFAMLDRQFLESNTNGRILAPVDMNGGDGDQPASGMLTRPALDAARQKDGRILTAGWDANGFLITCYNTDGSFDISFGDNGRVSTETGIDGRAQCVAIQADGKIVAAGYTSDNHGAGKNIAVVRYHANGRRDESFGDYGLVETDFQGTSDEGNGVAIQPDGKIVVAGRTAGDFGMVRFQPDGTRDATFGTNGLVVTSFTEHSDGALDVAIQTDGKIVAVGAAYVNCRHHFAIARYNTDGTQDVSFGNEGLVVSDFGGGQQTADNVLIQSDGKIVVTGESTYGGLIQARYDSDGMLDTSFAKHGFNFCEKPTTDRQWLINRLQPSNYFDAGVLECLE